MRTPISSLLPPMAVPPQHLPRLWPALPPQRQQQLAQRLAELLQRQHRTQQHSVAQGTEHDPR
ncbi:MAG: hypothetical protein V2J55_15090 [Candidatus Competibacteraceae bacterium]|nr:hypothetical protein [Candidatus Competibacteraceae bacterium]